MPGRSRNSVWSADDGGIRWSCELAGHRAGWCEVRIRKNGELYVTRSFEARPPALEWAVSQRAHVVRSHAEPA